MCITFIVGFSYPIDGNVRRKTKNQKKEEANLFSSNHHFVSVLDLDIRSQSSPKIVTYVYGLHIPPFMSTYFFSLYEIKIFTREQKKKKK